MDNGEYGRRMAQHLGRHTAKDGAITEFGAAHNATAQGKRREAKKLRKQAKGIFSTMKNREQGGSERPAMWKPPSQSGAICC